VRLQKHLHTSPRWARSALAALSLVGLIGLLAASGCINGESIESPSHDGLVADDPGAGGAASRGHQAAIHHLKAAIPAPGDVLITGGGASSRAGASAAALSANQMMLDGGFSGRAAIKNFSLTLEGNVLSGAEM